MSEQEDKVQIETPMGTATLTILASDRVFVQLGSRKQPNTWKGLPFYGWAHAWKQDGRWALPPMGTLSPEPFALFRVDGAGPYPQGSMAAYLEKLVLPAIAQHFNRTEVPHGTPAYPTAMPLSRL